MNNNTRDFIEEIRRTQGRFDQAVFAERLWKDGMFDTDRISRLTELPVDDVRKIVKTLDVADYLTRTYLRMINMGFTKADAKEVTGLSEKDVEKANKMWKAF